MSYVSKYFVERFCIVLNLTVVKLSHYTTLLYLHVVNKYI